MPLQSGHVFASHIGHTGKTTLCFQMSCYYAKRHADISVLVMDLAEEGDLTKRMLGGVDAAQDKVDELFGSVFRLFSEAERKASGLTSWLWSRDVDLSNHMIRVSDHNKEVPENLFLISSGAWPRAEPPMADDVRRRVCEKIKSSLEKSTSTWKLFCDTDGDRRPSPFTMLGYGLCAEAIVPLHLSKADLARTETMFGVLRELRESGEISTQVLFIVWNLVKSLKDEPCQHGALHLPFTPAKVNLEILDTCNERVFNMSQELPGVFVHGEASHEDFVRGSTSILRQLADTVLKPSEELGIPFVQMVDQISASGKKTMKFKTGDVEYATTDAVIGGVDSAVRALADKFEAMVVGGPAPIDR